MIELIIPAFIAGLITFLAPCTLPLVPGYLGFISGVKQTDLDNPDKRTELRRTIIRNGFFFVIGFTVVFVTFGTLAGLLGGALTGYRELLTRIGGVFVIIFGLFMLGILNLPILKRERRIQTPQWLTLGTPTASFIVGATFAFGWTPCIGPILGSILLLASSSTTALSGGFLLLVFSVGLSVPFVLTSFLFSSATRLIKNITPYLKFISVFGGIFLIILGFLLLTDQFELTLRIGFQIMDFLGLSGFEDRLLDYL